MLRKYRAQYSQIAESQFIKDKSKIGQSEIIMFDQINDPIHSVKKCLYTFQMNNNQFKLDHNSSY